MRYSLTHARPKRLLQGDTKLWWLFTASVVVLFLLLKVAFVVHNAASGSNMKTFLEQADAYEAKENVVLKEIAFVKTQEELGKMVKSRNRVLSDSIANLFDLVPEQIYLSGATITSHSLELRGYTPSKEVYEFLLGPPLKSIFTTTETYFYPLENGGYRFVSVNTSKEEIVYEKD